MAGQKDEAQDPRHGSRPGLSPEPLGARARDTARRDPSLSAARYRLERDAGAVASGAAASGAAASGAAAAGAAASGAAAARHDARIGTAAEKRAPTAAELRAIAKTALDRAIDAGEFDNLPLAGKPLPNLTAGHDPDWWIKAKIEREGLSGVAPPALSLRTENEQLDGALDGMATEASVRAAIADFNGRIVEARRQLTGGPPVVTPLRDADTEVERWSARRAARREAAAAVAAEIAAAVPPTWRERRRQARAARSSARRR